MTLIEYFVSAYVTKHGGHIRDIHHIIVHQNSEFLKARAEYDYLEMNYGCDYTLKYIFDNIQFNRANFLYEYKPNLVDLKLM